MQARCKTCVVLRFGQRKESAGFVGNPYEEGQAAELFRGAKPNYCALLLLTAGLMRCPLFVVELSLEEASEALLEGEMNDMPISANIS